MRGSLTEWGGTGSGKWKLRVYTVGTLATGRPTCRAISLAHAARLRARSASSLPTSSADRSPPTMVAA